MITTSRPIAELGWLWYRFYRRVINRYRALTLYLLNTRYRFARKLSYHYSQVSVYFLATRYRLLRRLRFRVLRLFIFFVWRMWVSEVHGFEKLSSGGPAIIVSNHLSYFDFWILSAILKRNTVFVAVKNLDKRSLVGWTMRLNTIVYVDREKPGLSFFKNVMWQIKEQGRSVVIYPEGTRSRSGKMLAPKPGFVKFAIKANIPIIPIAMKGTYEILPPDRKYPRLKRCDVHVLDKVHVSPSNPEFRDIFFRRREVGRKYRDLNDSELEEIAFRIMDRVRVVSGQVWDEQAEEMFSKAEHGIPA